MGGTSPVTEGMPLNQEALPLVLDDVNHPRSQSHKRSHWFHSASIFMAEVMGTGLLALPRAMVRLGWLLGLGSAVVFGAASTYSAVLLARTKNELYPTAESYADLASATGGTAFGTFTRVCVVATWSLQLPY